MNLIRKVKLKLLGYYIVSEEEKDIFEWIEKRFLNLRCIKSKKYNRIFLLDSSKSTIFIYDEKTELLIYNKNLLYEIHFTESFILDIFFNFLKNYPIKLIKGHIIFSDYKTLVIDQTTAVIYNIKL